MSTLAIIQARIGSTRFPSKVLQKIDDKSLIQLLLLRASKSKKINKIVVAIPNTIENNILYDHILDIGFDVEVGSEHDVLSRYIHVADKYNAQTIVRLTGDCPFIDPEIIDRCICKFETIDVDYVSNIFPPTFPDGLDVEVFSRKTLEKLNEVTNDIEDREHVTTAISTTDFFTTENIRNDEDQSMIRLTVDEKADLEIVREVFSKLNCNISFKWKEATEVIMTDPNVRAINEHIKRNEGQQLNSGQKLWKFAKTIIPGGNMLLSKRPEMFLPDYWPAYFSKSNGAHLWDLDGNMLTDFSLMGVGTNTLGYSHPEINDAVLESVHNGNMSTLNCPEEVELAHKLVNLHSWAEMARFTRSGGEANSVAIRIARAATGRDKVAICGYHGWHDWYLATNLSNESGLDEHLLAGLKPAGVPKSLSGTVVPFRYNDLEHLTTLISSGEFAAIKMEVFRNFPPEAGFLQEVRKLADKHGSLLIFDECTSGFRETFGGLHLKYNVNPDMAIFGKALGNGYAINAIIGSQQSMNAAQSTFISSTFWTERIGPTAAIKTLEVMERERSWERITETGEKVKKSWTNIAKKTGLQLDTFGLAPLASFQLKGLNPLIVRTFIAQEMLKAGFLASDCLYVCTAHSEELVEEYLFHLEKVFEKISHYKDDSKLAENITGPICHSGFERLN